MLTGRERNNFVKDVILKFYGVRWPKEYSNWQDELDGMTEK